MILLKFFIEFIVKRTDENNDACCCYSLLRVSFYLYKRVWITLSQVATVCKQEMSRASTMSTNIMEGIVAQSIIVLCSKSFDAISASILPLIAGLAMLGKEINILIV